MNTCLCASGWKMSMDLVLVQSYHEITSDKITERRKGAETLRQLLQTDNAKEVIRDRSSSYSSSRGGKRSSSASSIPSWDDLFKSVREYVVKESESILKLQSRPNPSSSSGLTLRRKQKQDVSDTLRALLKAANSKGGVLRVSDVISHIIQVLRHSVLQRLLAAAYTQILLNHIFPYPHFTMELTPSNWTDLQKLFFKFYNAPPESMDHSLIARTIQTILLHSSQHYDVLIPDWYQFFTANIKPAITKYSPFSLEQLLSACNVFSSSVASNARGRLCRLGEDLVQPVIQVWIKSSQTLKDQILCFLHIQIRLHHPRGVVNEANGAWACNDIQWRKCIDRMNSFTINELETAAMRSRSTSKCDVSPLFIDFTVDVMQQAYSLNDINDSTTDASLPPKGKKSKVVSGWSIIKDSLINKSSNPPIIWLQLIAHLFTKQSLTFPSTELIPLLSEIYNILLQLKRSEILHWVFLSLKSIAYYTNRNELVTNKWNDIWTGTIKALQYRIAEDTGYELLTTLLTLGLVKTVEVDAWKLICLTTPTKSVISFILSLLSHHKLPESLTIPLPHSLTNDTPSLPLLPLSSSTTHQYRTTLLTHICTILDIKKTPNGSRFSLVPVYDLSVVLVSLIQQSSSLSFIISSCKRCYQWVNDEFRQSLESFESCWYHHELAYLQSSFDVNPLQTPPLTTPTVHRKEPVIDSLCSILCEILSSLSSNLTQSQPVEVHAPEKLRLLMEAKAYCSVLILHVVAFLHYTGYPVETTPLYQLGPLLLKEVSSHLKDPIWSEADPSYYQSIVRMYLKHLSSLVTDALSDELKEYIQSFLPLETVQDIISISRGKFASWVRSVSVDSGSVFSVNEAISSSLALNTRTVSTTDDDAFEDDLMDSEPSITHSDVSATSLNSSSHLNLNILSRSLLSGKALVQQEACQLLVKWSYLETECGSLCLGAVKNITNDDSKDLSSPVIVQLIIAIIDNLLQSPISLKEEAIKIVLQSLRKVLLKHSKNYFIHKESLVLLKRLISNYYWQLERSDCLSLLSAFWNLYNEGTLCPDIRCSLADALVAAVSSDLKGNVLFLTRKRKKKETDPVSVRDALIKLLVDVDHSVRLHLARDITVLFPSTNTPLEHMNNFKDVEKLLHQATLVKSDLDEFSSEDESVNRVASMLCTLQSVACSARSCEHHVISLLVSTTGQGHMNSEIVKKVIRRISEYLGYANEIKLMEEMLSYLVSQWMNEGSISNFPYTLFSLNDLNEFYRKYYRSVVPHLLYNDRDSLQSVSDATLLSKEDLIKECLPVTMASILTATAVREGDEDAKQQAKAAHDFIVSVITRETLNSSLKHSLPLLVVELLTRLYEPPNSDSPLAKYSNSCDPEPIPPYHSLPVISATLNYLPSCFSTTTSSSSDNFISMLAKQKEALQTIALQLNLRIFSTHRLFERKRLLISYSYFSSLVCQELRTGLHGSLPYMVMDIIYSVGRVMHHHGNDEAMSLICCDTLTNVTKAAIKECPQDIGRHCHMIINTLLSLTLLPEPNNKPAIALLDYIIENGQIRALQDHLILLDPLPSEGPVEEASSKLALIKASVNEANLTSEIKRFCMARASNNVVSNSVQGLESLLHCLQSFHEELQINDPDTCNLILQLIHMLLNTAKSSPDSSCQVAKCLGQIGCLEMQSISAHVVGNGGGRGGGHVFKQERESSIATVLEELTVLLSDDNITVVEASSHCLRAILSTTSGSTVLNKLEQSAIDPWYSLLEPFRQNKKKSNEAVPVPQPHPLQSSPLLWKPSHDHASWLKELLCALITSGGVSDEVLSLVKPVCRVKPSFCEKVFPLVIHDILSANAGDLIKQSLSKQVSDFLSLSVKMDPIPHQSIGSVLDLVMCLRKMQKLRKGGTAWENNFWLDLNFLDVAMAAFKCSSYFTSLLYLEIWYNHLSLEASNLSEYPDVQDLLLQVYSCIGEHDGSYGAHVLFSPKEELTRKLDEHEGRWEELLTYSNWEGMLTGQCNYLLDKGCKNLGYYHILDMYKKGSSDSSTEQCYSHQLENVWRMTQWKASDEINLIGNTDDYHSCLQSLLLTMRHGKRAQFNDTVTKARLAIINEMVSTSLESVCNITPHLTHLQTLNELESAFELVLEPDRSPSTLLDNWKGKLCNLSSNFELAELILSVRLHALLSIFPHYKRSQYEAVVESGLLDVLSIKSCLAREAQQYQVAKGCVLAMKHIVKEHHMVSFTSSSSSSYTDPVLEEAKLYWSQGKADIAMILMKNILEKLEGHRGGVAYPTVLTLYGNWLSETLSENPLVILEEYLEKAVQLLESQPHNKDQVLHAYLSLARYSDSQFRRITDHMNSPLYQNKLKLLDRSKTDLQSMSRAKKEGQSKHFRQLSKHSEEDELMIRQHEKDQRQFLHKSIINYSLCLSTGNQYNLRIFRLISLWFSHSSDSSINDLIKDYVSCLPSYKLLPVIYQLAARMSSLNSDPFQDILQEMLYHLGKDHPYHSLYVILALSNAGLDNEFPQKGYVTGQRRSSTTTSTCGSAAGGGGGGKLRKSSVKGGSGVGGQCVVDDEKVKAAHHLLNRLRGFNGELLRDVSSLCEAYVDMAYHDVSGHKAEKKPIRIPPNCPLLKLKKNKVPIATLDHPVDPSGEYKSSLVTITSFDNHFSLCGGVNMPKVLSALCNDGKRRRQLIKGRDDLRQDAVMQQVFGLVNQLLCKKPSTANRKLLVRTYKVVPLSQCSGIVQWCEGTVPIGVYLVGPLENPLEGAHMRYRPKDWKNNECRMKFASCSKGEKLSMYNKICKNFKPVFHHFFMESFPDPALWYERRLTYTRSIATSSIVGYIMGLGDRHVQNILIDKQSAELIHIDLGVAFEQGRALPTPEVIPFRLTRDLVSGMGLTGVVGVFQRCCEETMEVMRTSHEELRTIVEVLLHDPLYIWTISHEKARHIQSSTNDDWAGETNTAGGLLSSNKMAERVLIRLQEKLEGVEDGIQLSTSGQVTHLIREARDVVNLSSLFHGWQPWI